MKTQDEFLWEKVKKTITPLAQSKKVHFVPRWLLSFSLPRKVRLDLHGYTVQEAFETFVNFIDTHVDQEISKVTVITGKGRSGQGQIRKEFLQWVKRADMQKKIISIEPVCPIDPGAFLIYLKRNKKC